MYNYRTIKISDYSNYNAETCLNGGNYAFYKIYKETLPGVYEVHYKTSAEFEFCDKMGIFQQCKNCCEYGSHGCERPYEYVSIKDLWKNVDADVAHLSDYRVDIEEH